jgi:hypothetical protein
MSLRVGRDTTEFLQRTFRPRPDYASAGVPRPKPASRERSCDPAVRTRMRFAVGGTSFGTSVLFARRAQAGHLSGQDQRPLALRRQQPPCHDVGGGVPLTVEPDRYEQLHRRHLELVAGVEAQLASARAAIRHSKALVRPLEPAPRNSEAPTDGHLGRLETNEVVAEQRTVESNHDGLVMEHNNSAANGDGI